MILSYRSSGTLLYPAFQGYGVKEFGLFEPITRSEQARFVVASVLYPGPLPGILLAFVAGLLLPSRRASEALRAQLAGTALGALTLFVALAAADELASTARYFLPFELGYFLSVCLAVTAATPTRADATIAMSLVVGALALQLSGGRDSLRTIYLGDVDAIDKEAFTPWRPAPDPIDARYAALQRTVPEHESLLVMLDEPFRLDFARNKIVSFDQPGSASPPPRLPIGKGPEALAEYLAGLGLRFVAFQLGGHSPEYDVGKWEERLKGPVPVRDMTSRGVQLRAIARFYVDVFHNLDKLAASQKVLYSADGMTVIDLATPR
jgi:hypothetical protein